MLATGSLRECFVISRPSGHRDLFSMFEAGDIVVPTSFSLPRGSNATGAACLGVLLAFFDSGGPAPGTQEPSGSLR